MYSLFHCLLIISLFKLDFMVQMVKEGIIPAIYRSCFANRFNRYRDSIFNSVNTCIFFPLRFRSAALPPFRFSSPSPLLKSNTIFSQCTTWNVGLQQNCLLSMLASFNPL